MTQLSFFKTRSDCKPVKRSTRSSARSLVPVDYSHYQRMGCKGCPLWTKDLLTPKMKPTGSKRPTIYVLGEAPGADEDEQGIQFVGRSGKLLRESLQEALSDARPANSGMCWNNPGIRWNNCCRCRPPNNRTPTREEWERCRASVVADIEQSKPKILVVVGNVALQWATGESTITKCCGRLTPIQVGSHVCWCYPILHPSFVLRSREEDGWRSALDSDLRGLGRSLERCLGQPVIVDLKALYDGVNYARDVRGLVGLARQLAAWAKAKSVVAFDIETTGLRPYTLADPLTGLLSIAFSDGVITWAVPVSHNGAHWSPEERERVVAIVHNFLRGRAIKVAHNLPFELEWLTSIYGHQPPWRRKGWGDTMAQAYVLDERRGTHSLDFLTRRYFGLRLKEQSNVDRSRLAELPVEKLLSYNALDAKYTACLYQAQREEFDCDGLLGAYKVHLDRAITLVKAQQVGLVVDFDRVEAYCEDIKTTIEDYRNRIGRSRLAKLYREKKGHDLSPTSPKQLAELFRDILKRSEGIREKNKSGYSVDDTVLQAMQLPIADWVLELRRAMKLKGTYLDGCARDGKWIYPDGRLHTKYNDTFTATGRLSSEDPNVQNFPNREDAWVRTIIVPPSGHVMLSADYGQIEYRVLGIASGDKRICDSLRDRYDVHMDWAERVAKADSKVWRAFGKDIKKLRSEIKNTMVFPAFYGAHADYIAQMIGMNKQKCRTLFDEFWEEFAGVRTWQRRLLKEYERDGYVSCFTGRRRRAPLTRNMIYNSPIQGSASDIVVDAMNRLSVRAEKDEEPALQPVMNIHDDLTFYVPRKRMFDLMPIIVNEMLHPSFDWVTVSISVEVSVGTNWCDMDSVGTFFSDDL